MSFDLCQILPTASVGATTLTRRARAVLARICARVEWMLRRYCDVCINCESGVGGEIAGPSVEVVVDVGGEECRIVLPEALVLRCVGALVRGEKVDESVLTALGFLVTEVLTDVRLRRPAALVDIRVRSENVACPELVAVSGVHVGIFLSASLRKQLEWYARFERPQSLDALDALGVACIPKFRISWRDLVGLLSGSAVRIGPAETGRIAAGAYSMDGVKLLFPEER